MLLELVGNNSGEYSSYNDLVILNTPEWDLNEIFDAYLECALWASELGGYSIHDFKSEVRDELYRGVLSFVTDNNTDLILTSLDAVQIGHSLWLTQNHRGAGFFDFPMNEVTLKRLTDAAHKLGERHLDIEDLL